MPSGLGSLEADQLPSREHKDVSGTAGVFSFHAVHPPQPRDASLPLFSFSKVLAQNWGKSEAKLGSVVLTQEKYSKTIVHIGISRGLSHRKRLLIFFCSRFSAEINQLINCPHSFPYSVMDFPANCTCFWSLEIFRDRVHSGHNGRGGCYP